MKPHPEDESWIATNSITAYSSIMLKGNEVADHVTEMLSYAQDESSGIPLCLVNCEDSLRTEYLSAATLEGLKRCVLRNEPTGVNTDRELQNEGVAEPAAWRNLSAGSLDGGTKGNHNHCFVKGKMLL
jgi:hypothetical protein